MSEPYGSERSIMPGGQCAFQVFIGRPTMRWAIPAARRWAAIDSPNGPAPMIRTSSAGTCCSLPEGFGFRGRRLPLAVADGRRDSADLGQDRAQVAPVPAVVAGQPGEFGGERPQRPAAGQAVRPARPPVVVPEPA